MLYFFNPQDEISYSAHMGGSAFTQTPVNLTAPRVVNSSNIGVPRLVTVYTQGIGIMEPRIGIMERKIEAATL